MLPLIKPILQGRAMHSLTSFSKATLIKTKPHRNRTNPILQRFTHHIMLKT